ncbi:hypothetical protein [Micromonospora echinofusca]|uniref:Uncharacterized protein n=1 Tax=Micromonospora echinofusca TaxID=47858 RepID=A0ABS3VRV2_MICEH|nr:hypothetical protein [Micromonospora echinofusca]MBO4207271.1 hypothetical protein [Micromonospora echinofusca]
MSDTTAKYHLWHPHYEIVGGSQITCTVDVAPTDTDLLDKGDPELVSHFAEQLGLSDTKIIDYKLHAFNTPYYSYDIDSAKLESSISPAWRLLLRLDVRCSTPTPIPIPEFPGPIPAWGIDQTWWEHRRPWDWNKHETIVIGLDGPEPELDFLAELGKPLRSETVIYQPPTHPVGQIRISLGVVDLPDQLEDVFEVVYACHRQAYVVHCEDSYGLFMS